MPYRLAFVGHCTIDKIIVEGMKPRISPGGSVVYASLAAKRMEAETAIVSKIGKDFPEEMAYWLSRCGIDLAKFRRVDAPTTRFILRYKNEQRTLRLLSVCEPIFPSDLAGLEVEALHLGPVAGEVRADTVEEAAKLSDIISLDPQGLVRDVDPAGYVVERKRVPEDVLKHVKIFKSSESELKASVGIDDVRQAIESIRNLGPEIVMITRGMRGILALLNGTLYEVPACKPEKLVDPTGAGDAFIGAFMAEYIRGGDPLWCVAIGSAASSFVLEGPGPSSFGSREEVIERANLSFENAKKVC